MPLSSLPAKTAAVVAATAAQLTIFRLQRPARGRAAKYGGLRRTTAQSGQQLAEASSSNTLRRAAR